VLRRRLFALAVVGGVVAAVTYSTSLSVGAPGIVAYPRVVSTGWPADNLVAISRRDDWRSPRETPLHLRYSWLRCDMKGTDCVPVSGLHNQRIVPPQELRIVTIRAAVTATNAGGSTTAVSRNFFFDEATRVRTRRRLRPYTYDPAQLRHWYGLRASQDGRGQTIALVDPLRTPGLRAEVDHFSARFRLPLECRPHFRRNCFSFSIAHPGGSPYYPELGGESEMDVEWLHAIAPRASIVAVQTDGVGGVLDAIPNLPKAIRIHVVSSSFCDLCRRRKLPPNRIDRLFLRRDYESVGSTCQEPHLVCVFPSGDTDAPGDGPSNSPFVLAAGGVMFKPSPDGAPHGEAVWPYGGYGETAFPLRQPSWQRHIACDGCSSRVVPDVSATARGVPTFDIFPPGHGERGWYYGGGTSLSSPLWAALIAIADQELAEHGEAPIGINELHTVLYRGWLSAGLDNLGHRGWSARTGWGSPKHGIVDVLVGAIEKYRNRMR
jgi:hypothetical protein